MSREREIYYWRYEKIFHPRNILTCKELNSLIQEFEFFESRHVGTYCNTVVTVVINFGTASKLMLF